MNQFTCLKRISHVDYYSLNSISNMMKSEYVQKAIDYFLNQYLLNNIHFLKKKLLLNIKLTVQILVQTSYGEK